MNILLDPVEARVIGSLMEKSTTTPEQYPLSLNALVNACNQRSSRDPVMDLSEAEVQAAVDRLAKRYLVREKATFGSRVPKYHYRLYNDEIGDFRFSAAERAVVCLLLLRGPQTPGELRTRAARLHPFADVEEVEHTLERLSAYEQGPFVTRLSREPGRREVRYAHLFSGDVTDSHRPHAAAPAPAERAPAPAERVGADDDDVRQRLERLEQRVAALEAALEAILGGRHSGA
ncbi:MAG: YceH family protein [Pseudomonadales bacterium]